MLSGSTLPNLLILLLRSVWFLEAFTLPKLKKTNRDNMAKPPKIIVFTVLSTSHFR